MNVVLGGGEDECERPRGGTSTAARLPAMVAGGTASRMRGFIRSSGDQGAFAADSGNDAHLLKVVEDVPWGGLKRGAGCVYFSV